MVVEGQNESGIMIGGPPAMGRGIMLQSSPMRHIASAVGVWGLVVRWECDWGIVAERRRLTAARERLKPNRRSSSSANRAKLSG